MNALLILRQNIQLIVLIGLTVSLGMIEPNLGIAFSLMALFLLGFKSRFSELIVLLLLMILLSDSREYVLDFFQTAKKAAMISVGLIVVLAARKYELERNIIFFMFLPFLIWSFGVAIFQSPELIISLQKTFSYSILFFAVPLLVQILLKTNAERFLRTLVIFIFVYFSIGLVSYAIGLDISQLSGRYRGLMGNPNGLGIVSFLFAILFDTINSRYPDLLTKRMNMIMWAILLINLLLCGSRSALAAFLIYWIFKSFKMFKGFLGVLVFILSLIIFQSVTVFLPQIIETLGLSEFLRLETLETGSGRLIAWDFAWSQIQDSFFIGRGFNYTELLFADNYRALSQLGHQGNAHSSFFTFWLDTGLVGLTLYILAFFLVFFRVSKSNSNAQAVMYAILFSVTFESWLTASLNPMTITLLIILSIMLYSKSEDSMEVESLVHT